MCWKAVPKICWKVVPLPLFSERVYVELILFFLKSLIESTSEAIWSGLLFVERFLVTDKISFFYLHLFQFSISS